MRGAYQGYALLLLVARRLITRRSTFPNASSGPWKVISDIANCIESMEQHHLRQEQYHLLHQKLQTAKQLEYLSNVRDEHVLNTAKWLVDNSMASMKLAALRGIIPVGWAVYRYPVLGQVNLC